MDLHKDKERLRHQNQVRLLNKVMNIIPRCPHAAQTRVKKLRHLVLYYHFIKMIHAHTSKDRFKVANGNKSIIRKKKARPVCELPQIQYEREPKRRRANIVFLQVDRSTPKKPNIHEKAVLNVEDYETFYDLEESALTINLGYHDIPEVAAVNDVSVNQADFSSDISKSQVNDSNLVSYNNKASFVSNLVNQNQKLCLGLEPIIYSEEYFSSDKENLCSNKESFSGDKENLASDKGNCSPVIENCVDGSSDDKRVKEFSLCNIEKAPETLFANNNNSLYDKYESNIPLNISNTHSSSCLSKNFTQQNLNTNSNSILKERNCNRFETYPGQKALEEYVSSISFGSRQNNIDKKLYAHKSSSSLIEKNTDISETYLIQNPAQYVSSISPGNYQDNIGVSNFENCNSSFVKPQLYDMPSFSNSGSSSSNLSTDVLNIIEPISDTSNHSYIDFFDNAADNATSLSGDGNEFNRPVYSTCDVNYLSVPEFADTSLASYDEIRNSCFLPVCYNFGYLGNNALQNDVAFGVHSNGSLPYYGNMFPVGVLENPAVIHPLGFYNSYPDTLTKSNYINEDVSFYSACSNPMTVGENINSEKIPFVQPKQEVENSNCYLSAMSETNKSSFYDENSSYLLPQYMNKY